MALAGGAKAKPFASLDDIDALIAAEVQSLDA